MEGRDVQVLYSLCEEIKSLNIRNNAYDNFYPDFLTRKSHVKLKLIWVGMVPDLSNLNESLVLYVENHSQMLLKIVSFFIVLLVCEEKKN